MAHLPLRPVEIYPHFLRIEVYSLRWKGQNEIQTTNREACTPCTRDVLTHAQRHLVPRPSLTCSSTSPPTTTSCHHSHLSYSHLGYEPKIDSKARRVHSFEDDTVQSQQDCRRLFLLLIFQSLFPINGPRLHPFLHQSRHLRPHEGFI